MSMLDLYTDYLICQRESWIGSNYHLKELAIMEKLTHALD